MIVHLSTFSTVILHQIFIVIIVAFIITRDPCLIGLGLLARGLLRIRESIVHSGGSRVRVVCA